MPSFRPGHLLLGALTAAALFGCYGAGGTTAATPDPNAPALDGNGNPIITDEAACGARHHPAADAVIVAQLSQPAADLAP